MFEIERSSKRDFFARLHREGRKFMTEPNYDYFGSNEEDDTEPDEEPEKESENNEGFWGRMKRHIKG